MTPLQALAVGAAGLGAGAMNAVVGAGTLITFPTLLAIGLPPVTANVTNTVGLVPGSVSAAYGYRRELAGQRRRVLTLAGASVAGALAGGLLLLALPQSVFKAVVPVLILTGCALVLAQPRISRRLADRRGTEAPRTGPLLLGSVFLTGVYGGYFGAAQGVLLIALLTVLAGETLQRANGAKNVLAALVNLTAALLFAAVTHVDWAAAALIAVGSVVGALVGAAFGRRLPDPALRGLVVVVGLVAAISVLRS